MCDTLPASNHLVVLKKKNRSFDRMRAALEAGDPAIDGLTPRVFKITDSQRQHVARCLRYIDQARLALEAQRNPDNREIIRELKASADRIFDLMNDLEETGS